MKTKHNAFSRPLLPLALLAGSVVVLAAGTVYLRTAWPVDGFTLTITQGDPAALEGFALKGRYIDYNCANNFILQDGVLTQQMDLGMDIEMSRGDGSYLSRNWYVSATEHDAVDASADVQGNEYKSYSSTAKQFTEATTFYLKGTPQRSLRLPTQGYTSDIALEVWGQSSPPEGYRNDYVLNSTPVTLPTTGYCLASKYRGDEAYFGLSGQCLAGEAGVYRVTQSLTQEEISALPPNATLGGEPILAGDTPYGSYTPFYTLPGDVTLADYRLTADGGCCLLTVEDGAFRLLYVDATGTLKSTRPLGHADTGEGYGDKASFLSQTTADGQKSYGLYLPVDGRRLVAAFAIVNGTITDWQQQPSVESGSPTMALLSADHTKMMTVYANNYYTSNSGGTILHPQDDIMLAVYTADRAAPIYQGTITAGIYYDEPLRTYNNYRSARRHLSLDTEEDMWRFFV